MLQFPGQAKHGFSKLNAVLASGSNLQTSCPYVWDSDSVILKNPNFDELSYRSSKVNSAFQKDSGLTLAERKAVLDQVFESNQSLLLEISYASSQTAKKLDKELDKLILNALTEAEHQSSLRISKDNIARSRSLTDGWMSYADVNEMLSLSQRRKFSAPDREKFVKANR